MKDHATEKTTRLFVYNALLSTGGTDEMLNAGEMSPLYYQIANVLRSKIKNGEYEENCLLPSEQDLCKSFGVSRITVRQATALLKREGFIYPRPGYGTIVCPRQKGEQPYAKLLGSVATHDLVWHGSSKEFIPISKERCKAPEFVSNRLKCDPDEDVFCYMGLRSLPEVGEIVYTESFLPLRFGPSIPIDMMKSQPLFVLLQDFYGLRITKAEHITHAVSAEKHVASRLKVKLGAPLLRVTRTFFTKDGEPLLVAISYVNTDKLELIIELGLED
jgi:GntR family transcriptional regulator